MRKRKHLILQENVKEFHLKYGLPVRLKDQELVVEDAAGRTNIDYRIDRIREESRELIEALYDLQEAIEFTHAVDYWAKVRAAHEHVLKEVADVNYVSTGIGVVFGYDVHAAEQKVHDSNMTKTGSVNGGKLTKGEGYIIPDLSGDIYK